jgi:hypothetical protein
MAMRLREIPDRDTAAQERGAGRMSQESDRVVTALAAEVECLKRSATEEANAVADDLREAVTLIFSRAGAREEARLKKVQWEEIVPLCRAAKNRFDKLNAEAEKQNEILAEARRRADIAESHLNQARDAKPSPYPTAEEICEWKEACQKLEDSLEAARAKVRAANQTRGELTGELIRARNEFTNLMFRERNMRPRQTEPGYQATSLAGVR